MALKITIKIILLSIGVTCLSCNQKHVVPKNLISLNSLIPILKDSAYYYAYYKVWFSINETIDDGRTEILKNIFKDSKFIYSNKNKYLIIANRMPDGGMISVFGFKKDVVKKLFHISPSKFSEKYGFEWKIKNQYIIVRTGYYNGNNFGPGFMLDSYDYLYGFKKDSLVILDSIMRKHRENKLLDVGMKTIISSSKATIIK